MQEVVSKKYAGTKVGLPFRKRRNFRKFIFVDVTVMCVFCRDADTSAERSKGAVAMTDALVAYSERTARWSFTVSVGNIGLSLSFLKKPYQTIC